MWHYFWKCKGRIINNICKRAYLVIHQTLENTNVADCFTIQNVHCPSLPVDTKLEHETALETSMWEVIYAHFTQKL